MEYTLQQVTSKASIFKIVVVIFFIVKRDQYFFSLPNFLCEIIFILQYHCHANEGAVKNKLHLLCNVYEGKCNKKT